MEKRQVLAAFFPAYADGTFTLGDPDSNAPYALADTFKLETNPGAAKTIFLDFDGHHSRDNSWGHDIQFPAFDRNGDPTRFSNAELIEIQKQFQNVAEDFAPFDVNVTTKDPGLAALTRTSFSDATYGVRAVNTQPTRGFGDDFGGIAYLNSFNDSIDNPVFVINKGVNVGGMTNSHEVGHALGLYHDGLFGSAYHPGSGSGEMSWGPILGAPFSSNITQWSNGDYTGSTTTQDDLAIITNSSNGINYKPDDHGNFASASTLGQNSAGVFDWGVIGQRSDVDFFEFTIGAGNVNLSINAFGENPNLDIRARIHDSTGRVIAANNPSNSVNASISRNLAAGTYYVSIDGVGRSGLYSDYGSLGFYTIEGSIPDPVSTSAVGESGRISNLYDAWKTVTLSESYTNPVVVAGPASTVGGDPVTVRIRNVTRNSFQIRIDEWEYRDGRHGFETVDYLVMEAGTHQLSDGTTIVAKNETNQRHQWKSHNFGGAFADSTTAPIVLTQTTTINENVAVISRLRNVTQTGFQLRIQEEQAADRVHQYENISWIAIEPGQGNASGKNFEAIKTSNSVTHLNSNINFRNNYGATSPSFFASMQSFNGGDTASVRYRNLSGTRATVFLEEERSADLEILHNPEVVGYLAIGRGPILATTGTAGRSIESDNSAANSLAVGPSGLANAVDDQFHRAEFRASMNQRGMLIDGDLSVAMQELESWGEFFLPLGEVEDHDGHDHEDDEHEDHGFEIDFERLQGWANDQVNDFHDWHNRFDDSNHNHGVWFHYGEDLDHLTGHHHHSFDELTENAEREWNRFEEFLHDADDDLGNFFDKIHVEVDQLFERWF